MPRAEFYSDLLGEPHPGLGDGLLDCDDMGLAMKDAEVQCQHKQNERDES